MYRTSSNECVGKSAMVFHEESIKPLNMQSFGKKLNENK